MCMLLAPVYQGYASSSFVFFLLQPLTVLMKHTRQVVRAIKQSILLRCLWMWQNEIIIGNAFWLLTLWIAKGCKKFYCTDPCLSVRTWDATIDIESLQNRLLKVCYVPTTSVGLPKLCFFFFFILLCCGH